MTRKEICLDVLSELLDGTERSLDYAIEHGHDIAKDLVVTISHIKDVMLGVQICIHESDEIENEA